MTDTVTLDAGRRRMRLDDWPLRLDAFIDDARPRPFVRGAWDCCAFVAAAVEAMTGLRLDIPGRGDYADADGAAGALDALGLADVAELADRVLGDRIAPPFAQRGDVVLAPMAGSEAALALCLGDKVAAVGRSGLVFLPMRLALAAWRV